MMVADTGPIIAFARIGRLDLLHQVVGELIIPEAIYEELVGKGRQRPGAAEVERAAWNLPDPGVFYISGRRFLLSLGVVQP